VTLRDDIANIERRLDDAALRASASHRKKYLRIAIDFMRSLLAMHLELIDQVERELGGEPAELAK
jgi:hypothetical protein